MISLVSISEGLAELSPEQKNFLSMLQFVKKRVFQN